MQEEIQRKDRNIKEQVDMFGKWSGKETKQWSVNYQADHQKQTHTAVKHQFAGMSPILIIKSYCSSEVFVFLSFIFSDVKFSLCGTVHSIAVQHRDTFSYLNHTAAS